MGKLEDGAMEAFEALYSLAMGNELRPVDRIRALKEVITAAGAINENGLGVWEGDGPGPAGPHAPGYSGSIIVEVVDRPPKQEGQQDDLGEDWVPPRNWKEMDE